MLKLDRNIWHSGNDPDENKNKVIYHILTFLQPNLNPAVTQVETCASVKATYKRQAGKNNQALFHMHLKTFPMLSFPSYLHNDTVFT